MFVSNDDQTCAVRLPADQRQRFDVRELVDEAVQLFELERARVHAERDATLFALKRESVSRVLRVGRVPADARWTRVARRGIRLALRATLGWRELALNSRRASEHGLSLRPRRTIEVTQHGPRRLACSVQRFRLHRVDLDAGLRELRRGHRLGELRTPPRVIHRRGTTRDCAHQSRCTQCPKAPRHHGRKLAMLRHRHNSVWALVSVGGPAWNRD